MSVLFHLKIVIRDDLVKHGIDKPVVVELEILLGKVDPLIDNDLPGSKTDIETFRTSGDEDGLGDVVKPVEGPADKVLLDLLFQLFDMFKTEGIDGLGELGDFIDVTHVIDGIDDFRGIKVILGFQKQEDLIESLHGFFAFDASRICFHGLPLDMDLILFLNPLLFIGIKPSDDKYAIDKQQDEDDVYDKIQDDVIDLEDDLALQRKGKDDGSKGKQEIKEIDKEGNLIIDFLSFDGKGG